jgi:hypothetical protein
MVEKLGGSFHVRGQFSREGLRGRELISLSFFRRKSMSHVSHLPTVFLIPSRKCTRCKSHFPNRASTNLVPRAFPFLSLGRREKALAPGGLLCILIGQWQDIIMQILQSWINLFKLWDKLTFSRKECPLLLCPSKKYFWQNLWQNG